VVYDGSRALIHLLSVDPSHQRRGVGSGLERVVVAGEDGEVSEALSCAGP
jgi:hypothetical protein